PAHRDPRNPLVELDEHEIAPRFLPFGHAFLPADDRPGPGEAAESRRSPSARQGPAPGLQSSASGFLLYAMVLQPQAPSRIWSARSDNGARRGPRPQALGAREARHARR